MRFHPLSFLLIAVLVQSSAAGAQPLGIAPGQPARSPIPAIYQVLANGVQGPMDLTYNRNASGPVTGGIFRGDRLEGYHVVAPSGRSLAFVRYIRTQGSPTPVAAQVYLANQWLGGWAGVFYALNAAPGGASAQRNVFLFHTIPLGGPCRINQPNCPPTPPTTLPASVQPPLALSATPTPLWVSAGASQSLILLTVAADGSITGSAFGDAIAGHYAAKAGMIAFLRLRKGRPFEAFVGTLDADGAMGGTVHPLAAGGRAGIEAWRVVSTDAAASRLLSIHQRTRCLTTVNASAGAGARLTTHSCDPNTTPSWTFVRVDSNPDPKWRLASTVSGLCAQTLASSDGFDLQPCSTATGQELMLVRDGFVVIANAADLASRDAIQIALERAPRVGRSASSCMGMVGSTGEVTPQSCAPLPFGSKTSWGRW